MGGHEEGGVLTQEVKKAMFAIAVLLAAALAGLAAWTDADESSAVSNHGISGDKDSTSTEGKLDFKISFSESDSYTSISITYSAKLTNRSGSTQANAVSPSSGSLVNGVPEKLTVTAPKTAGTYTLVVTYTEQIDDKKSETFTDEKKIKVVNPVVLSLTVKNEGTVSLSDVTVYFYVDDKLVENSDTKLSVKAGEKATIKYNYGNADLSHGKHTFYAKAADGSYLNITGLDEKQTFYYKQGDYDLANYLMLIALVVLIVVAIYIFTRPVKNYGKPKSRR